MAGDEETKEVEGQGFRGGKPEGAPKQVEGQASKFGGASEEAPEDPGMGGKDNDEPETEGQIYKVKASEEAPEDPGMGGKDKDDRETEGQGFRAG